MVGYQRPNIDGHYSHSWTWTTTLWSPVPLGLWPRERHRSKNHCWASSSANGSKLWVCRSDSRCHRLEAENRINPICWLPWRSNKTQKFRQLPSFSSRPTFRIIATSCDYISTNITCSSDQQTADIIARTTVIVTSTLNLTPPLSETPMPCCIWPVELGLSTHEVGKGVIWPAAGPWLASPVVVDDRFWPEVVVASRLMLAALRLL